MKSHLKYNTALDEVIKSYLALPLPVKLFYQRAVELIRQTVTCRHGGIIHDKSSWQSFALHTDWKFRLHLGKMGQHDMLNNSWMYIFTK